MSVRFMYMAMYTRTISVLTYLIGSFALISELYVTTIFFFYAFVMFSPVSETETCVFHKYMFLLVCLLGLPESLRHYVRGIVFGPAMLKRY
jgi:hypothetical protein